MSKGKEIGSSMVSYGSIPAGAHDSKTQFAGLFAYLKVGSGDTEEGGISHDFAGHLRLSDSFHYLICFLDVCKKSSKYIALICPTHSPIFVQLELTIQPQTYLTQFAAQSSYTVSEVALCSQGERSKLH